MKKSVTDTSIETYYGYVVPSILAGQKKRIFKELLRQSKPVSRRFISKRLGIDTATVSARVNALIASGLVCVEGRVDDADTGRSVQGIYVPDDKKQLAAKIRG